MDNRAPGLNFSVASIIGFERTRRYNIEVSFQSSALYGRVV